MPKHNQTLQRLRQYTGYQITRILLASVLLLAGLGAWLPQDAQASGEAFFILSASSSSYTVGNSFTVTVYETSQSADNVEGVQANLSYNTTDLQCTSVSESGTLFTYLGQSTCASGLVKVGEASASTVTGQQLIATISFKALAAGSPAVSITTGSDIQNSSLTSVWNGVDTKASYTLSNPSSPSGGGTTGGGSSKGSSPGTTKSSGSSKSGGSSITPTPSSSTPSTSSVRTATPTTTTQMPSTTTTVQPTMQAIPSAGLTITVTNSQGKPVSKAKVVLSNHNTVYTNSRGKASISGLSSGTYTVLVTAPGKKPSSITVALTSSGSKQLAVKLSSSPPSMLLIVDVVLGLVVLGGIGFGYMRLSRRRVAVGGQLVVTPSADRTIALDKPTQGSVTNANGIPGDNTAVSAPSEAQEPTIIRPPHN